MLVTQIQYKNHICKTLYLKYKEDCTLYSQQLLNTRPEIRVSVGEQVYNKRYDGLTTGGYQYTGVFHNGWQVLSGSQVLAQYTDICV